MARCTNTNRNTATAANTCSTIRPECPGTLVRNQFGGSSGGKIVRDRASTSSIRAATDGSGVAQVARPSDTLRHGLFKYTMCNNPGLNGICDPTKDTIFVQTISASESSQWIP